MNEAIRTQASGDDQAEGLTLDLSQIDVEKLRDEFAKKMHHEATALQDIREIVADYNREKDRVAELDRFWEKEQAKADITVRRYHRMAIAVVTTV